MRFSSNSVILAMALALPACSGTATIPGTGTTTGDGQLAVVNALLASSNVHLLLDNAQTTLPASGQTADLAVSAGTHHLTATSASGATLASADFTVTSGGVRTAIISGAGGQSVALDMAVDTATHGTPTAAIQLVDSASMTDSYDFAMHQIGTDSLLSFEVAPTNSKSTIGYLAFMPGTYAVSVTAPGSSTVLVQGQITVTASQIWNLVLAKANDGTLTLQPKNLAP